jgi:aromatic ring-opening dioxygenase LigB subunit
MINYLAYLPHPPIMLEEIGGDECAKIKATINSQKTITQDIKNLEATTDLLLIMSPHAPAARNSIPIYSADLYSGNLANFGRADVAVQFNGNLELTNDLLNNIRQKIAISTQELSTLDHGVLVPLYELYKLDYQKPILFTGLNIYNQKDHYTFGELLAEYAKDKNILFIGSGDMSHALKEDGPYSFHPAGPKFDEKIISLIKNNKEDDFLNINPAFQEDAAECGFRSLLTIAGICSADKKLRGEVLSYEGPFGVGYLAARWQK